MSGKTQAAALPIPALADLLDQAWTDDALAALTGGDERLAAGPVPRAAWEAALLAPARDMLSRPGKRFREVLVALAWRLAGGRGPVPAGLPQCVELVHAGSLIVDDVEDDSSQRRGAACLHRLHGVPLAINVGSWLYFWAFDRLGALGLDDTVAAEMRAALSLTLLRGHFGQSLDLSLQVGRAPQDWIPPVVAAATDLKTGALMELAARLGALAARAPVDRVATIARFGRRLGVGLQMLDDLGNLAPRADSASSEAGHGSAPAAGAEDKRHEDLRLGRPTWPWAWAAEALDPPAFAALQTAARLVRAQALSGNRPRTEPLAAELRAALGVRGRRAARVHLERAMLDLEHDLGPVSELRLVTEEIERLEAAYG
jgi:geranylgeranyl pyrophosphate synthase